jgi:outer membrane protein assembly factor BamA
MRVHTALILIAATLATWATQGRANCQPSDKRVQSNPLVSSPIQGRTSSAIGTPPLPQTAMEPFQGVKYGDYVSSTDTKQASEEGKQTAQAPEKVVKDIQIRFVNKDGKLVDDKGQPIVGRTRTDFILGELRLKPGQAFRQDLLQEDLQRLRRLESLDDANVSLQEDETGVVITYDLKERHFPALGFTGGNRSDDGLYIGARYLDANISGRNDQFSTSVKFSGTGTQFDGQFTSRYRREEPNRLGYSFRVFRSRDLSPTFTDEVRLPDLSRAREGRFGGGAALLRSFGDWDGALGLNFTRISIRNGTNYDVTREDIQGNPLSVSGKGIDDLYTVSFALTRDKRDRRENPTTGSILSLSTTQSLPIGLGKISSNRLLANYIQYLPVSWIGKGKLNDFPEIVAFNLQAGATFGEFPPADAFNLGGLDSVRGYETGKLASGRDYGLASVEYRFPIRQFGRGLVRAVGGVVFADVGTDFGTDASVLGEPGVVRHKPGTGAGVGFGLRLNTPLGIIRGDLGVSDRGQVIFEIGTGQRF